MRCEECEQVLALYGITESAADVLCEHVNLYVWYSTEPISSYHLLHKDTGESG